MPTVATTKRLLLRTITLDDASFLLALLNSPGWIAYIGDRGVYDLEQAKTYIQERFFSSYVNYGFGFWVMESLEHSLPIGICGLVKRPTLVHPDLGFAILPPYQKQGYTQEASLAVLELAVQQYQLTQVDAIVLPTNTASIGLLQQLGFVFKDCIKEEGENLERYSWQPSASS